VVDIQTRYEGDLHCTATHGPSGAELATDAPVDHRGRGQSFSPTDLVAAGLGTCMLSGTHGIDDPGRADLEPAAHTCPVRPSLLDAMCP
jgi:hypothetical protein